MKTIDLKGKKREVLGRKSSRQDRKQDLVPCVIYGAGRENVHFSAEKTAFKHIVYTPQAYIVNIDVDGTNYHAVLKDVQYHPVSEEIEHIDFLQVVEDRKVIISVPVHLHGFPVGVKEGGKLAQLKRKLKISAFMKDLPESIELNVDHLKIAQSIKVQDIKIDNIDLLDLKNSVVATVKVTRAVVEEVVAAPTSAAAAPAAAAAAPAAKEKAPEKKK